MKKSYILIAPAIVAALSIVSCKNNNKAQEPTHEEIQEQKQALADSVLAEIDSLTSQYADDRSNSFRILTFELTEKEKMVKPDYLLDPSEASNFITKSQKLNALAIYTVEYGLRRIYDMPFNEVSEAIARLSAELNLPEYEYNDEPLSDKIKRGYATLKERGEITSFWQFEDAISTEIGYIVAQNPDLVFSRITEEQWKNFYESVHKKNMAIRELAEYDEEMADVLKMSIQTRVAASDQEAATVNTSIESAKQFRIANKDRYIAKRNALLQ